MNNDALLEQTLDVNTSSLVSWGSVESVIALARVLSSARLKESRKSRFTGSFSIRETVLWIEELPVWLTWAKLAAACYMGL